MSIGSSDLNWGGRISRLLNLCDFLLIRCPYLRSIEERDAGARVRLGQHRSRGLHQGVVFAMRVLSAAMSTSVIRPMAATRLVSCLAISSPANRNLDIDAPLSARRVAMFSIA